MWIAADTLLLASTLLLTPIDPICSEPMTLEELFSGYKGVMPPVERFSFNHQFRNFETFGDKRMEKRPVTLVKRGHIIFGWWFYPATIRDPYDLFPNLENVFIAFDMDEERWISLPQNLSRKLGTNRRFHLLVARDEVAASHVTTSNRPLYREAHMKACEEANDRADIVEEEQVHLLNEHASTIEDSKRVIREEYSQAYNRAFMLHLHPHGEYNIHGYRKRQP